MKMSLAGLRLLAASEGLRLTAYRDPGPTGLPITIGYGSTRRMDDRPWTLLDSITKAHAEELLARDVEDSETVVRQHVKVPLTQGQFDALCSFVFNVGPGRADTASTRGKDGFVVLRNGNPSTMLTRLNKGDYAGAAAEFDKWTLAGGVRLEGLVRRRRNERTLFEMLDAAPAEPTIPQAPEPPVVIFDERPAPVDQPGQIELVSSIWKALRAGYKLSNSTAWKSRQNIVNGLVVVLSGATVVARYFGHDLNLSQDDLVTLSGAVAVAVGLFNNVATTATSTTVGVSSKNRPVAPEWTGPSY